MYAVIRAGGKQYRVSPGDVIRVETQEDKDGKVQFSDVLAVSAEAGSIVTSGATASVSGEIVEQGRGEKLDPRSDLYSVGVILFEMLTRRVPFEAENAIGVVLKHITEEPPVPSQVVPGVDPRLDAIALHALRKFREERFQSAREMRAELRLVVDRPGAVRPSLPLSPPAPPVGEGALANAATVAMPMPPPTHSVARP